MDPVTRSVAHEIQRIEAARREKEARLTHVFGYLVYGYPVRFTTDDPALLKVARLSARAFSRCVPIESDRSIRFRFFRERQAADFSLPDDLAARLKYQFVGRRLAVVAAPWLRAFVDVERWTATGVVAPPVVQKPRFLSHYICNNFTFHLLMRSRPPGHIGHLHASTLCNDGRAVILCGPHNAGKSTTALRLMIAGYRLVTDSTTLVRIWNGRFELVGYPIGRIRLRLDTLDTFPQLEPGARPALTHSEKKVVIDLRKLMPDRMMETSIFPEECVICAVERRARELTKAERLSAERMLELVRPESVFAEDPAVNPGNLKAVERLLRRARCYRLELGTDNGSILRTIDGL